MKAIKNFYPAVIVVICTSYFLFSMSRTLAQTIENPTNYLMKYKDKTTPTFTLLYEQSNKLYFKSSATPPAPNLNAKFTIDASGLNEPSLKLIGNPAITSVPALKITGYTYGIETSGSIHVYGSDWLNMALLTEGNILCNGTLTVDRMDNENYSISSIGAIKAPKVNTSQLLFSDEKFPGNFYTCSSGFDFYVRDPNHPCTGLVKSDDFNEERTLRITHGHLEVLGSLETYGFQLSTGAGRNKVLTSDEFGVASWTEINSFNDNDWLRTTNNDLYSNCRFVGIGTNSPTRNLDVVGDIAVSGAIYGKPSSHAYNKLQLYGSSNVNAGYIELGDGTTNWNCVKLFGLGEGGNIQLWAGGKPSMTVRSNEVLLGNKEALNAIDLRVNGKIYAMEVKVSLDRWEDIVFDKDYQLLTLNELDTYITNNKHLPDIPSEKEVLENGINVGEMNALLLKKIEELTLYIIDQQKQIDELRTVMLDK